MNLIEQHGSYENLKSEYLIAKSMDFRADVLNAFEIALLDYRRANNIYEVGDDVVFTVDFPDVFDVDEIYRIGKHTHGQFAVHKNEELICWCGDRVFDQEFRHATDEEIKAGKRL